MNSGKICISICARTADEVLSRIERAAGTADVIELRLDCLSATEVDPLLANLPTANKYLITFRPREHFGYSDADKIKRLKFWAYVIARLKGYDFLVDYEGDIDFPLRLDPERTIVSLHDFENRVTDLPLQFEILAEMTGKTIKIAVSAIDVTDSIEVWKLVEHARRIGKRVIPIAMGEAGKWTRILGLAHGAPMTYASLQENEKTAPGQISADDLVEVFRVKDLDETTGVYGIVAGNTSYSLSPYVHNAAFKHAGINSVFVPLQTRDVDEFFRRMVERSTREVELNFQGFAVTNPHKIAVMKHLDEIDETARAIGAVNTVKIEGDRMLGHNTDADGFIQPLLRSIGDIKDARVIVAGAGGAARACVYALKRRGADVTIVGRDREKVIRLADEFGATPEALTTDHPQLTTDILVNATPVGTRGELELETIATADELRNVKLVYDLVYNPRETRLIGEARSAGVRTIGGLDMLIAQAARQFQIWTGQEAPVEVMRSAVEERLQ